MGQCEDLDNQLKQQYGDDYRTNREAFPLSTTTLSALSAITDCKEYFGYESLVSEFCGDATNIENAVGNGKTCKDYDTNGSKAKTFCLSKQNATDDEPRMRVRTDFCNSTNLKDNYNETAVQFCRDYPKNPWCKCYNITNKVCDTSTWNMQNAAGCRDFVENLDTNKAYFKDGYSILRENAQCRPRVCDDSSRVYIPQGALDSCQSSYHMCDKDLNIRALSNSDIVLECNRGMTPSQLPSWWDSTIENARNNEGRRPPFDTYPWNKLPITRWPTRFRWKDKNVRYLTYASTVSISMCSLCMMLIASLLFSKR